MEAEELQTTARMARLALDPVEEERLRAAVEQLLAYCSQMASLDVDDLEPTTHALLTANRLRPDGCPDSGACPPGELLEGLLANAPEREERFILIPNVL
jgi:aspartyl-tRNA(Asn)/glutamyl-tRNA(Gln) amidotransferase subunit C